MVPLLDRTFIYAFTNDRAAALVRSAIDQIDGEKLGSLKSVEIELAALKHESCVWYNDAALAASSLHALGIAIRRAIWRWSASTALLRAEQYS